MSRTWLRLSPQAASVAAVTPAQYFFFEKTNKQTNWLAKQTDKQASNVWLKIPRARMRIADTALPWLLLANQITQLGAHLGCVSTTTNQNLIWLAHCSENSLTIHSCLDTARVPMPVHRVRRVAATTRETTTTVTAPTGVPPPKKPCPLARALQSATSPSRTNSAKWDGCRPPCKTFRTQLS